MIEFAKKINTMIDPLRALADKIASPLWDLGARLFIAQVFWASGWLKLNNALHGNWESTVDLFKYEHPVPGLSPEIAAIAGTSGEIILPILLTLGLFTRFSAAGLLIMTAIIQFTYFPSWEHWLWAAFLSSIFIKGPGIISADFWIVKYLQGDLEENKTLKIHPQAA